MKQKPSAILFGITNLQTVIYYKKYPDDWWVYRHSVTILWTFDALHVALGTHALYHHLIDLFSDYIALGDIVWSFKLQILFNMVIILGVQVVYINSLLAMLNSRTDHHVSTSGGHSMIKVLKFESQDSGVNNEDRSISIPMRSFQSLNPGKEGLVLQLFILNMGTPGAMVMQDDQHYDVVMKERNTHYKLEGVILATGNNQLPSHGKVPGLR
ncbi:hypothetical protein IW261DRAFT_1572000 [Armillaria novae-zelandiae]|uniref:Uncharacterized protein n=1 Tax=Armillaria novae-zelandiae TaxID=153914 RepID=A0AA39NTN7_9AGAR|nr:hypothetical protein IW261DRAFT_1572000 [Armillaria novae-zelandiae]